MDCTHGGFAAANLENWAPYFLWEHDGRQRQTEQYLERANLCSQSVRLEKTNVLESRVLEIIKGVKDLRKAVAHRHGTYGVTETTPQGRLMGIYRGGQVFREAFALQALVEDVADANSALIAGAHRFRKRHEVRAGPP